MHTAWIGHLHSNLHAPKVHLCKQKQPQVMILGTVMPTPADVRLNPDDNG